MSPYLAVFLWACAVVAALLLTGYIQHLTHPHPTTPREPATPRVRHTCHVRGCGRNACPKPVTRRDTLTPEWVCIGCRDQGYILGYWLPEAAA